MASSRKRKISAKVGNDTSPQEGACIYDCFARSIPVAGLAGTKIFFRSGDGVHAVSRRDIEKKGKAYDRKGKEWIFSTEGAALAAMARQREKQNAENARFEAARAAYTAHAAQQVAQSACAAQKHRATESDKLHLLKQQMADAHPDRSGTSEAFIAARNRYLRAKAGARP